MKSSILLSQADQSRLDAIIHRTASPPHPDPDQTLVLRELLSSARPPTAGEDVLQHVEFGDYATLISQVDPEDSYKFRVVMPSDADLDLDHISVCTPVAAAVLGRSVGELVEWQAPIGLRRMRLIAVGKLASS